MKQAIIFLLLCMTSQILGQTYQDPYPRHIQVTGSAEMEIVPTTVTVSFSLMEYYLDTNNDGKIDHRDKKKIEIAEIEDDFIDALYDSGVKKEDIYLSNLGGYYGWYYRHDQLKRKSINVVFTDIKKLNKIIRKAGKQGLQNMQIAKLDHPDMEKFKRDVKINAMKAAKEKAKYLLESVDEQVGSLITVYEIENYYSGYNNYDMARPEAMSNMRMADQGGSGADIDNIRKIKLKYQINAKFAIK